MFTEDIKYKNFLWWLASIAVSVLCCSTLFVLFAGYLVEIKSNIQDQNMRLSIVESRQNRILAEIETLRMHAMPVAVAPGGIEVPATPDAAAAPLGSGAPSPDAAKEPDITLPTISSTAPTVPASDKK